MPRRSGGGSSRPMSTARSAPAPVRQTAPAPVHHAPPAPIQPAPQGPGLFAQMATTAAGVAVGSAVGHAVGHAFVGGGGGHSEPATVAAAQQPVQAYPQQSNQEACSYELDQFLQCSRGQTDITLCQGFNEAWKQCRARYGL